uniref:Activin_recp domain-containing protein n=1 Tax=Heterorhabditis bacteriophora TaxID=37862 RepID=A0A1I7W8W1_HETBA
MRIHRTNMSMKIYSVLVVTFIHYALALQCYTGFTYLAGQSIGTSKEICSSSFDYCYNATADLSQLNNIKVAGCSTTRCFLSRNKCIKQTFQGKEIKFCCCNTGDLCNSKLTNLTYFEKTKQRVKDIFGMIGKK